MLHCISLRFICGRGRICLRYIRHKAANSGLFTNYMFAVLDFLCNFVGYINYNRT